MKTAKNAGRGVIFQVQGKFYAVNFEGDEYHTATSKSLKEDEKLLKAGFEYVTERGGVKIFRKRK